MIVYIYLYTYLYHLPLYADLYREKQTHLYVSQGEGMKPSVYTCTSTAETWCYRESQVYEEKEKTTWRHRRRGGKIISKENRNRETRKEEVQKAFLGKMPAVTIEMRRKEDAEDCLLSLSITEEQERGEKKRERTWKSRGVPRLKREKEKKRYRDCYSPCWSTFFFFYLRFRVLCPGSGGRWRRRVTSSACLLYGAHADTHSRERERETEKEKKKEEK